MDHSAIRFATLKDYPNILKIYSHYILTSAISFETEVPSENEFVSRFKAITSQFPWLVYEVNNQILGYAYGSTHRSRRAKDWSCEVTVYIDKDHHQKGIGTRLYNALFSILKEQGYYNLFAGVTQPNEGSDKIHMNLGFEKIGIYKNIGFKFSKWHDVAWYQFEINSGGVPHKPVSSETLLRDKIKLKAISPKERQTDSKVHRLTG